MGVPFGLVDVIVDVAQAAPFPGAVRWQGRCSIHNADHTVSEPGPYIGCR